MSDQEKEELKEDVQAESAAEVKAEPKAEEAPAEAEKAEATEAKEAPKAEESEAPKAAAEKPAAASSNERSSGQRGSRSRDNRDRKGQGNRRGGRSQFKKNEEEENQLMEKVIRINRINKVVKGGKRLGFRAFVIAGNMQGQVGLGLGKSKEVPSAIKKAVDRAKKYQTPVVLVNGTIPHEVEARFGASRVIIRPAPDGTGVIAGGAVKILLEAAGLKNVVAKTFGSRNSFNAARAALIALLQCKDLKAEELKRGKKLPVYVVGGKPEKEDVIKEEVIG